MIKALKLTAAALMAAPILASAMPVSATVQSSVEGGDIYRIKNVTKNVDFSDPATASACDVLLYKVRIHNPGPTEVLNNVTVQAAFPTAATTKNTSIVVVRASNANPSNTSDPATVNFSSAQSLSYVNGSTQLLDQNGALIKALPDGITQAGVSIGTVGVSINEKRFVQFQEKVNCPVPPTQIPVFSCDALNVTAVSRTKYTFTAEATAKNGATITNYAFDFGDGTKVNSTSKTVTHEYTKDGKYTVTTTLTIKVGDKTFVAEGKDCTNGVTVVPATEPPVVTPPTEPLPNTGPGAVVGIVAGTSAVATALHYGMAIRRTRRDEI